MWVRNTGREFQFPSPHRGKIVIIEENQTSDLVEVMCRNVKEARQGKRILNQRENVTKLLIRNSPYLVAMSSRLYSPKPLYPVFKKKSLNYAAQRHGHDRSLSPPMRFDRIAVKLEDVYR